MPHKRDDIFQYTSEQLRAFLDERNLRHTPERFTILSAVCRLQRFTIDELRQSLTTLIISRATIYNTLSLLVEARLVQKLEKEFGVRTAQYELVGVTESTVQIVCQRCGRVSVVKDSTISRMLADKRWANFIPDHYSLYLFGNCKVCRKEIYKKQ